MTCIEGIVRSHGTDDAPSPTSTLPFSAFYFHHPTTLSAEQQHYMMLTAQPSRMRRPSPPTASIHGLFPPKSESDDLASLPIVRFGLSTECFAAGDLPEHHTTGQMWLVEKSDTPHCHEEVLGRKRPVKLGIASSQLQEGIPPRQQ